VLNEKGLHWREGKRNNGSLGEDRENKKGRERNLYKQRWGMESPKRKFVRAKSETKKEVQVHNGGTSVSILRGRISYSWLRKNETTPKKTKNTPKTRKTPKPTNDSVLSGWHSS